MAGEFTWDQRLKGSLYRHIRGFIILGIAGLLGFIYLFFEGKLTISNTPVLLIVLSNC